MNNLEMLEVLQEQVRVENDKLVFGIELEEQQGELIYDLQEIEIVIPDGVNISDFEITDDERYEILNLLEEFSEEEYGVELKDLYDTKIYMFV